MDGNASLALPINCFTSRALVREFNFDKRHLQQANCIGKLVACGLEGLRILHEEFRCEPGALKNRCYEDTPKAREESEQMMQYFVEQMGGNMAGFPGLTATVVDRSISIGTHKLLALLSEASREVTCSRC